MVFRVEVVEDLVREVEVLAVVYLASSPCMEKILVNQLGWHKENGPRLSESDPGEEALEEG